MLRCSAFGIVMLDDGFHMPLRIAHDAPISGRLVELDGQYRERARIGDRNQLVEGGRADQRHVPVQHQHRVIVGNHGHRLHHGMPGTQLIGLQHPFDVLEMQRRLHMGAAMTVDDVDVGRMERARGADDVLRAAAARPTAGAPWADPSASACPAPRRV